MAENTTTLVCPKCAGQPRGYERNNVTIDQCDTCRGIFLDRGELERLIDAESSYYQPPTPAAAAGPADGPGLRAGLPRRRASRRRGQARRVRAAPQAGRVPRRAVRLTRTR